MKIIGTILPSGAELGRFSREHPIVTIFGALAVYSASTTLIKALTNEKGNSPYASAYNMGLANIGIAAEGPEAWLKHEKSSMLGMSKAQIAAKHPEGTNKGHIDTMHALMKQGYSFEEAHNEANRRGFTPGGLGASTSTTTSTSASHAMMPKEAAPTLLETQGASSGMFGRMRATPPSLRRRIAQSVGLGATPTLFNGKQDISAKREEINLTGAVANLYSMEGFVPEMAENMVVV